MDPQCYPCSLREAAPVSPNGATFQGSALKGLRSTPLGVDLGIKTQVTLSGGLQFRYKDIQNKLLAFLKRYPAVVLSVFPSGSTQDDQVKGWQGQPRSGYVLGPFGRQVRSTAIGGLKARLKQSLTPSDREVQCTRWCFASRKHGGWKADRDHNAALVILLLCHGQPHSGYVPGANIGEEGAWHPP